MLEEAVNKAKQACEQYLASTHDTKEARLSAFDEVLKTANAALVATVFTAHLMKSGNAMLEIYNGHKNHGMYKQVLKISLGRDGRLVREDFVTCTEGCHVYRAHHNEMTKEALLEMNLPMEKIVENIMTFLNDPNSSLGNLGSSVKN